MRFILTTISIIPRNPGLYLLYIKLPKRIATSDRPTSRAANQLNMHQ